MVASAQQIESVAGGGIPSAPDLVGQVLRGTYRIVQVLDRGGMGTVLDAEHIRLHRRVAIKLIADHLVGDPDVLARFRDEAEIISQLQHPHVVQVFDYDSTERGQPFLVMELLHGESLAARLDRERLIPMAESVRIAGQIASALGAAHAASIVHRDLKPANVYLVNVPGEPAFVKLLDFGISKRAGAHQAITRARDVLGTPEYMAPEQAVGRSRAADHRADQYALAVIVYEMLSGRPPFRAENAMGTLYQVVHDSPIPLADVAPPWLPAAVSAVVQRALSKNPADRYPDVHAFAEALVVAAGCSTTNSATPAPATSAGRYSVHPHANAERVDTPPPDVVPIIAPLARMNERRSRPRLIGSPTVRAVGAELDSGLCAWTEGRIDTAAEHVERALELALDSNTGDAHEAIEAMTPQLELILTEHLGGPRQRLAVLLLPSASRREKDPTEAFLLSRIDDGATLDDIVDISPMSRLETLRCLASLADRGVIGKRGTS